LSSNYDLRPLAPTLRTLRERGWEVGLHGDFGTHDSEPKMAEATERLRIATGARPKGVREHFLRFDYDVSWGIMDRQGFVYDSSVGNRERIGFRLGLCNPFHPPGPDWTPLRVLEVPLVLMDTTLWGYLKRDEEAGKRDITDLRRKVSSADGLFTVLWHQEAARMRGGRLYPWLLDELLKDGCYVGSGDEIAAWWRSRAGPMLREGSVLRMENCPGGLTLRFKTKEERKLSVQGGKAETRANEAIIRVDPGNFRMEVD
jgi:peptidoglycan/xylan/chitin deacetylase (PgdA/CDA1 family)